MPLVRLQSLSTVQVDEPIFKVWVPALLFTLKPAVVLKVTAPLPAFKVTLPPGLADPNFKYPLERFLSIKFTVEAMVLSA